VIDISVIVYDETEGSGAQLALSRTLDIEYAEKGQG